MIATEVTISFDHICYAIDAEDDMRKWLLENIGALAPHRDQVDEHRPWCVTSKWRENIYHFAREADATAFTLRWS